MQTTSNKWRSRPQKVNSVSGDFPRLEKACGLARRLGCECSQDAWTANPIVERPRAQCFA